MPKSVFLPERNGQLVEIWLSEDANKWLIINASRVVPEGVRIYRTAIGKLAPKTPPKQEVSDDQ